MKQWNRWKSSFNCGNKETKTDAVEKNTNRPCNSNFQDRKGNKQMGMRFLVNESLKVTKTNVVNKRITTLTLTKKDEFEFKSTRSVVKYFAIKKQQVELTIINVHAPPMRKTSSQVEKFPNCWFLHWSPKTYQMIPTSETNVAVIIFP